MRQKTRLNSKTLYKFKTEQWLPVKMDVAWDFFSSPKNLSVITPPELDFRVLTRLSDKPVYSGMIIDYTVKPLLGIPLHWQTEITDVNVHHSFADRQIKGPYKVWNHIHYFAEQNGGVLMKDEVTYELPLGILGRLIHPVLVRKKIEHIFEYRRAVLERLFLKNDAV